MTAKKDKNFSTRPIKSEIGLEDTITVGETGVKRTNKPLMEKRRRARINQSLQILKAMIVEANTKNVNKSGDGQQKHNKLEKADILEITVRHFQRHRNLDNPEVNKYRAGYADCAREVSRYLATPEPPPFPSVPSLADPGAKSRLLKHLEACVGEIDVEITSKPEINRMHETNPLDFSKSSPHLAVDLTRIQKQDPNNNSDKADPPKRSSKRNSRGQSPGNLANSNKRVRNNKPEEIIIVKEEIVEKPDMSNDEKVLLLSKHYVQLASALGLNPQAMLETSPTTTDFESLIELSKHQPHMLQQQHLLDPPQPIETMDPNYWDLYKKNLGINESKCPSISPTSFKDLKSPSPVCSSLLPLQDKVSNKIPDDTQSLKSSASTTACPSTKYVNKKKDMIRMHDEIELKTMQAKNVVCSGEASDGASAASISSDVSEKHFSGQSSENSCENLENQQQNYVGDDEDVWRPW